MSDQQPPARRQHDELVARAARICTWSVVFILVVTFFVIWMPQQGRISAATSRIEHHTECEKLAQSAIDDKRQYEQMRVAILSDLSKANTATTIADVESRFLNTVQNIMVRNHVAWELLAPTQRAQNAQIDAPTQPAASAGDSDTLVLDAFNAKRLVLVSNVLNAVEPDQAILAARVLQEQPIALSLRGKYADVLAAAKDLGSAHILIAVNGLGLALDPSAISYDQTGVGRPVGPPPAVAQLKLTLYVLHVSEKTLFPLSADAKTSIATGPLGMTTEPCASPVAIVGDSAPSPNASPSPVPTIVPTPSPTPSPHMSPSPAIRAKAVRAKPVRRSKR